MREICAALFLASTVLSSQANALGTANKGCHILVAPEGGQLKDEYTNDELDGITGLKLTIQFSEIKQDGDRPQKNGVEIDLSSDHNGSERISLSCSYNSSQGSPSCGAMRFSNDLRLMLGLVGYTWSWPAGGISTPMNFSIHWTNDGNVTLDGDGAEPHSLQLSAPLQQVHLEEDHQGCEIEIKNPN